MKSTLMLLLIAFFACTTVFGQSQIGMVKDPQWNIMSGYNSKFGNRLQLSNNTVAMIVNVPKVDFAIINLDDKLAQSWLTPLTGYPLAIGKFKNDILVVSAVDRFFFKSFGGSFKAYLLEEKTGKVLLEKIIYEGNKDFIEEPDFFFAKDGSYFRMTTRLTGLKRKTNIFTGLTAESAFRETQNFSIVNYDSNLNQREKIDPRMPEGESWMTSNGPDGSLFIATVDNKAGKINTATYISSSAEPLKMVTLSLDLRKGKKIASMMSTAGAKPFINYLAVVYENSDKKITLLSSKIDFKDGTSKDAIEVFDNKHVKELRKSFIPVNKKFDDLEFSQIEFLGIKHVVEYGDKLLVAVSPSFIRSSKNGTITLDGSVLMNVYDQELKGLYHQFIPRKYKSLNGEGSDVGFSLKDNTLRMVTNMRTGGFGSVYSMYSEMDFLTGKMLKTNKIPDKDIKRGFYVNTGSITWLGESLILPYFDKQRLFRASMGAQMQLLSY